MEFTKRACALLITVGLSAAGCAGQNTKAKQPAGSAPAEVVYVDRHHFYLCKGQPIDGEPAGEWISKNCRTVVETK